MCVRGVSFHVGSGGSHFKQYKDSIENSKKVFEMAKEKGMPEFTLLDIGGGFSYNSANQEVYFEKVAP